MIARTTLITWIFLSPAAVRTTSKESFSSAAPASPPPPPAGAAAATATGAAAVTPHSSSIAFFSSTSSSTVILPSVSSTFAVSVAISFRSSQVLVCGSGRRVRGTPRPYASGVSASEVSVSAHRASGISSSLRQPACLAGFCLRDGLLRGRPRPRPAPRPPPRRARGADVSPLSSSCAILASIRPDQVLQRCVQHRHELAQRGDDHPDELSLHDVERRQLREALDLLAGDRASRQHTAPQRQDLRLPGSVAQRLGHRDRVAVGLDERDRRRALEHGEQRIRAGRLSGPPGERVLDHGELGAVLQQLHPEGGELAVRQPAIVGDEQRVRRAQALGQILDHSLLVCFLHLPPPLETRARLEAGSRGDSRRGVSPALRGDTSSTASVSRSA